MGLPCALIFSIGALVNIRVSITILVKEFGPPGLAPRYCYRECGTKGLARRVLYQDVGTTMMQLKHQYGYFCTQIIGLTLLCQVLNTKSLVTRMYILYACIGLPLFVILFARFDHFVAMGVSVRTPKTMAVLKTLYITWETMRCISRSITPANAFGRDANSKCGVRKVKWRSYCP